MKILIVVDYQKDFVDKALGFKGAELLDEGISALIRQYIQNGDVVIVTYDTHQKNYLSTREGRKLQVEHCIEGTDGWELYGKTGDTVRELTSNKLIKVKKETFGSLELASILRGINPSEITFVGIVTNMCVISNAVIAKAACPEAEIFINKALTDSFDPELRQKALDVMASMQMEIY